MNFRLKDVKYSVMRIGNVIGLSVRKVMYIVMLMIVLT